MKKFYLFCSAGMSTSLLANNMQKIATAHNLPIEVKAFSITQIDDTISSLNPDVILLGPQVKHEFAKISSKYEHTGKPIFVIDSKDYGDMNGERVLKVALKAYKEKGGN